VCSPHPSSPVGGYFVRTFLGGNGTFASYFELIRSAVFPSHATPHAFFTTVGLHSTQSLMPACMKMVGKDKTAKAGKGKKALEKEVCGSEPPPAPSPCPPGVRPEWPYPPYSSPKPARHVAPVQPPPGPPVPDPNPDPGAPQFQEALAAADKVSPPCEPPQPLLPHPGRFGRERGRRRARLTPTVVTVSLVSLALAAPTARTQTNRSLGR
jgi:hypothetical protein